MPTSAFYLGDPPQVRRNRAESALHKIARTVRRSIGDRRALRLAAPYTLQAKDLHQPLDGPAGHRDAFSVQLEPHFAGAGDSEVLRAHAFTPVCESEAYSPLTSATMRIAR